MTASFKTRLRPFLPKSIRAHRILAGPLRSAVIYTSWHDYPGAILGTTEKSLLNWLRHNVSSGETWIDVGAHYGYTAIALCRLVGPRGRVVAFEPVLSTAGCVARTRELNRLLQLQIVPLGLASCPEIEIRRLPLVRGMADSTIHRPSWEEPITVASFDAIWKLLCGSSPKIHGVKIDVQGMELDVLEGMRGALSRHQPKVIVEFHHGVDRRSILSLLGSCGYSEEGEPIESEAPGGASYSGASYSDDKSYAFYRRSQMPAVEQELLPIGRRTSELF